MSIASLTYQVDSDNIIVHLSGLWDQFAIENGGVGLLGNAVIGKHLFEFIANVQTRHIYQLLFDRCKEQNLILEFPFRCDSPETRRFMSMRIEKLSDGGFSFRSSLMREEIRDAVLLLAHETTRSDETIISCGWCNKIMIEDGSWMEVEEGIAKLDIFGHTVLPRLSHSVCESCYMRAMDTFNWTYPL